MSRWFSALIGSCLLSATLAGCAAQTARSGPLAGTEWRFLTIDGAPAVSENARLAFTEEGISGSAGCNSMGGPWRIEGGRLIAGPLMQTEMYCEGPVWSQEQAVSALLVSAPRFTLAGERLTFEASGHSAELARLAPNPPGR